MLAARLGITRVIATDVIRQVLRAFFTHEAMPTVHHSAFEAGRLARYPEPAEPVGAGVGAIVERAAAESKAGVLQGVARGPPAPRGALRDPRAWRPGPPVVFGS